MNFKTQLACRKRRTVNVGTPIAITTDQLRYLDDTNQRADNISETQTKATRQHERQVGTMKRLEKPIPAILTLGA
ncbi:hypothetical protein SH528x_001962 [Novipirellula sp. SH528]|uniref:hypothetical protein n=1 Tax=Novipirellula sp. SH528 TaxID=3454466 RepID=UPI003FA01071